MESIQQAMQRFVDEGQIAGIGTLATRQGEVIHSACYGMLDKEAGKPLRPDSLFRIYSLTKPVTAVALFMLIEEGSLKLDDPIARYFPALGQMKVYSTNAGGRSTLEAMEREITIWHLLTHTSGLAYGYGIDDHPVEKMYQEVGFLSDRVTLQISLRELVDQVAELPLAFQPGASWRYGIGFDIIGHLIEMIAGKPFDLFLKERLFEPLGMADTSFFVPREKQDRFGPLYSYPQEGEVTVLDRPDNSPFLNPNITPSGGVGLVSTLSDYARFLTLLTNEGRWDGAQLLSQETVKQMTSNQLTGEQFPVRFADPWPGLGHGLGVGVQRDHSPENGWPAGTYGWLGVSGTWAWIFPEEAVSVMALPQAWYYWDPGYVFQKLLYEAISS